MKLSKAQVALLRQFGEGKILEEEHLAGDMWFAWDDAPYTKPGIRYDTLLALSDRLLVRAERMDGWHWFRYTITPAGRAYLGEE